MASAEVARVQQRERSAAGATLVQIAPSRSTERSYLNTMSPLIAVIIDGPDAESVNA